MDELLINRTTSYLKISRSSNQVFVEIYQKSDDETEIWTRFKLSDKEKVKLANLLHKSLNFEG